MREALLAPTAASALPDAARSFFIFRRLEEKELRATWSRAPSATGGSRACRTPEFKLQLVFGKSTRKRDAISLPSLQPLGQHPCVLTFSDRYCFYLKQFPVLNAPPATMTYLNFPSLLVAASHCVARLTAVER